MERDDTLAKVLFQALCAAVEKIDPGAAHEEWDGPGEDMAVVREVTRAGADAVEAAIKARA